MSTFEVIEHPNFLTDDKHDFYKEIAIYYSLLFLAAIMFEIALRAARIKNQTIKILDARHNLSMQLSAAKDWDDVVSKVLRYPASIFSTSATSLLIYDHSSENYLCEQSWIGEGVEINLPYVAFSRSACCSDDTKQISANFHLMNCSQLLLPCSQAHEYYHLILNNGDDPIGILIIVVPKKQLINHEDIQLLSKTAEDMANGLSAARHRQEQYAIEIANAASNERLEIARDLHDTLGQNLGYLHFKLDQLLTENNGVICQANTSELMRLRELANESYELVRHTLVILHHNSNHNISKLITAHSQIIAKRAGFKVNIKEDGTPRAISPQNLKQFLHAYKEAMFNIETHSQANEAMVNLSWTDEQLTVRISDNGKGFDPSMVADGHYGLHIIDERIKSIGGDAEINSAHGQGTEVVLRLPLADEKQ